MESPPVAVRARTQATAVDALQADSAERALSVCVQQPAFRQPDDDALFILLGVTKWLRALVAAHWCGRLVLRTSVYAPDKATALAAWLSRHGALLAELELEMDTDGADWYTDAAGRQERHALAHLLEQLPGNLTRLVLTTGHDDDDEYDECVDDAQEAAADALAATFSRQPMQLRSLQLPRAWHDQLAAVLPGLAALSQLTSLVTPLPRCDASQLPMQHLPAQLQQLEVANNYDGFWRSSDECRWLALEHVTGLTRLSQRRIVVDGGALPRKLRALAVETVEGWAPILQLGQLTALEVDWCCAPAEQLHQLSRLSRLEQLSVGSYAERDVSGSLAAALRALPALKHLKTSCDELTAACLDHLGACTRLTHLQLNMCSLAPGVTPEQLAAMLGRLTALESYSNPYMRQPSASDADWAPVCQALARLPRLAACDLSGAKLGPAAAAHLAAATQLTELYVADCGLDDTSVLALCSGLTSLRCLGVGRYGSVTDCCLEGIAALRQLRPGLRVQSW